MSSSSAQHIVEIWLATPAAEQQFDPLRQSPTDQAKWARIRGDKRRREWAVSRALLAHIGERALDELPPRGFRQLSLSHSASHAAVVLCPQALSVGVDIETIRERDYLRLAEFSFAATEHAQLSNDASDGTRAENFFIRWTVKEAFCKALGIPLLQALREITLMREANGWRVHAPIAEAWSVRVFRPRPELILSVVALWPEAVVAREIQVLTHEWPDANTRQWNEVAI